jgi:hypothetical protein
MSADYDANVLEVSPGYTLVQAFQANDNAGVESYPGWFDVMTLIGVSGQSNLVTYHPDTGVLPGSPGTLSPPADGQQVLATLPGSGEAYAVQWIEPSNPGWGTIQPGRTLTMTATVGVPSAGFGWSGFNGITLGFFDLQAVNEIVSAAVEIDYLHQVNIPDGSTGLFFQLSATLDCDASVSGGTDGTNYGDTIGMVMVSGGDGTMLDNIQLSGTGGPPVPEPSSLALLSAGMLSLLAYAWRKRK